MTGAFPQAIEALFQRAEPRHAPSPHAEGREAKPTPAEIEARRKEWFAKLVSARVMPLLEATAEAARRHGISAASRLVDADGRLAAELTLVVRHLPKDAKPPRLTVYLAAGYLAAGYLAAGEPPLMVEYTGSFPGIGATGGFGAEIDYVPVYPGQLEEKVLEFADLATGGGTRLTEFPR
ncbi:MAG TPA: hypothetical protein VG651_00340 [Stellaceae bacterium]|nr:hypothetical protein [Stellaceae bacterium]